MSYDAGRMRPALGPRLPARAAVMPVVMVGSLTALLLLLPLTVLTIAQHSARRSAVSATQDVSTEVSAAQDLSTTPPMAPVVPQPVEDVYVAPAQPAPDPGSPAVAEEQAPLTLVPAPDTPANNGQRVVGPDSALAPAPPPVPMAPALRPGMETGVAPVQQEEEPPAPLSQVSAPAEPAPQVIVPVQSAPSVPPPVNNVETTSQKSSTQTTSQQSGTQSNPGQSKRRDDHEKGGGPKKDKRD